MNLASSKAFKGLAVGSLALAISGVAAIPALVRGRLHPGGKPEH